MGESKKITFSVVICTLHNFTGLEKCVKSIGRQTVKPREVIVVHGENGGNIPGKIQPVLESNSIAFKYLKSVRSLVLQRNIGIDHACGDVIVFLDDDVILDNDYFFYLLQAYQSKWSESLGGIQGVNIEDLNNKPWQPKEIIKKIFLLGDTTGNGRLLPSASPSFCSNPKEIKKVEIFSGCMMSFRRDILIKNRFDVNFREFWVGDDIELSYRISRKYQLYITPFARIRHISSSRGSEGYKKIARMHVFNRLYMFKLYFSNSKVNWLLFFWSNIGDFLSKMYLCVKLRNIGPLSGFFEGWKMVFAHRWRPYKQEKGESI